MFLTNFRLGTFARVWLACLAGSRKEGQKVFALKILRKVDSTYIAFYFVVAPDTD